MLFFSIKMFSQTSIFSYKIKLQGVTDSISAYRVSDVMHNMFQARMSYNNSTECFEFNSKINMNETGFEYNMTDEGYKVIIFEKKEFIYEVIDKTK